MLTRVSTVAFEGIDARAVEVQVLVASGSVVFNLVGLPDKAVSEAKERVRAALLASGLSLPPKRITVNLAPADVPKEGSHFDMPIALALMVAMGAIPQDALEGFVVLGELGLDGSLAPVAGVLPAAVAANAEGKGLICPEACGAEAAWASPEMPILAPRTLLQLANHIRGTQVLERPQPRQAQHPNLTADIKDIRGQEHAKRALEITAAGGHNMLMVGPPGAGKSMLAQRLPGLLPPLLPEEILEVSMIGSVAGLLREGHLMTERPYRAPHHSASMAALIGGGLRAKPGEVSLAHAGVLFLDELPEFQPQVLDSLRQPLESGEAVIARANVKVSYPARFQLITAMNPCRCGYAYDAGYICRKGTPANCVASYMGRISGPFLDRLDVQLDLPAVTATDMLAPPSGEDSTTVRARVLRARELQSARYVSLGLKAAMTNATVPARYLDQVVELDAESRDLLTKSAQNMKLSGRGLHRAMRVARTLADLDRETNVRRPHIAEALAYRLADPQS